MSLFYPRNALFVFESVCYPSFHKDTLLGDLMKRCTYGAMLLMQR